MRNRLYVGLFLLVVCLGQVGCILPIFSSSPDVRARQLIFQSESYRHIPEIWERMWGLGYARRSDSLSNAWWRDLIRASAWT